jgi:hypothetical protein
MAKGSTILFDTPESKPADSGFLEALGYEVLVCHGPKHGTLCPILSGAGCEVAENAHGIVFELDLDRAQHRAILAAYKEKVRDDVPLRVVVKPEQAAKYADLLAGLRVWTHAPAVGDLDGLAAEVEAVDRSTEG